ncbi:hypothetical protein ACJ72_01709 [Emergomyces africanus]|uniref:Cytochrome b5 heme-binding domain-containing protein n=1 Tax=Emergomyces africanus TaxID=1955775 RepID=A0A1B7P4K6_9EURO|nr:hypothetical protein ACJ72_01709 [Emergomyces africanus]
MSVTASKLFSKVDVSSHNKDGDMWIIIDQEVYDISKFQDKHPGGKQILFSVAGSDATKKFHEYHRQNILNKFKSKLIIGSIAQQSLPQEQKSIFSLLRRS